MSENNRMSAFHERVVKQRGITTMKDMKFTIIVPVYNVVSYIDRCVHSVVIQDYANWELLLIDDGSTDGSGEKCDVWSGRDNRVITIHKANGGVSSARNAGLEKASGDYITFIDADDYWETSGVLSEAANHVPCDVIYMVGTRLLRKRNETDCVADIVQLFVSCISQKEKMSSLRDSN